MTSTSLFVVVESEMERAPSQNSTPQKLRLISPKGTSSSGYAAHSAFSVTAIIARTKLQVKQVCKLIKSKRTPKAANAVLHRIFVDTIDSAVVAGTAQNAAKF